MKTLKLVALFVGFSVASTLPASFTVPGAQAAKDCMHLVLRVESFKNPKRLFNKPTDAGAPADAHPAPADEPADTKLTQADFMTISMLASLASNTMISKNNSAFRAALCTFAALHGSYFATQLWGNNANRFCAAVTGGTVGAVAGAADAAGWKLPQIHLDPVKVNKMLATIIYLLGQNAPQFLDILKEYWKGGLLNPMPFIRIVTKNRDHSELAAIAVRNLLPLALLTENGAEAYGCVKTKAKPHLVWLA